MPLESCCDKKVLQSSLSLTCLRRTIKELCETLEQSTQRSHQMDNADYAALCAKQLEVISQHFSEKSCKNNLNAVLLLQEKITSCLRCIPVCRPSWTQVIPSFLCLCKTVSQLCVRERFQNTTHKDIKILGDNCSVLGDLIVQLLQSMENINFFDAYLTITNFYKLNFFLHVHTPLLMQTFEFLRDQCYKKFEEKQETEILFLIDFILHVVNDERINVHIDDKLIIATKLLQLYVRHPIMVAQYPKLLVESLEFFSMMSQISIHRSVSQADCLLLLELHNLTSLKRIQNLSLEILALLTNERILSTSLNIFRNKKKNFKEFLHDKNLDWMLIFSYIPLSYTSIMDKDIIVQILRLVYDCTLVLPNEEALRMINKCLVILIHFYCALPSLPIQVCDTGTTQMLICFIKLLANHYKIVVPVKTTSTEICELAKTLEKILPNALKLASLTVQANPENLSVFLSKDTLGRSFYHICCFFITSLQLTKKASEEFINFCKFCFKPSFRCKFPPDLMHCLLDCFIQLAEFFLTSNAAHTILSDLFTLAGSICQELKPGHQLKLFNVALCCLDKNYLHSFLVMQVTEFLYLLIECHRDLASKQHKVTTETFYAPLSTLSVKSAMYQSRSNPIRTNVKKILAEIPHSLDFLDRWITCVNVMEPLTDEWNMGITGCTLCLSNERFKPVLIERLNLKRLVKNLFSVSQDNNIQNAIQQDTSKTKSSFFVLLDNIASLLTCLALSSTRNGGLVLCFLPKVFQNCVQSHSLFSQNFLEQLKKVAHEILTSSCNISINENIVQKALTSIRHFIMSLILSEGQRIHGVLRACWFVYIEKFIFNSEVSNYLEKCLLLIFEELFAKTPAGYKCCPQLLTSTLKLIKPVHLNCLKDKNHILMKMEKLKVDSKKLNAIDVYDELNSFTYVVLLGIQQLHVTPDSPSSLLKKEILPCITQPLLNQFLTLQKSHQVSFCILQLAISVVKFLHHEENESFTKVETPKFKDSINTTSVIGFLKPSFSYSNNLFSNGYTLVFLIHLSMFIQKVSTKRTNQLFQQLLYQVYNFTVFMKSVECSKSCLEESLIQGLCFLTLQIPTRHPKSTILFKQLFTILLKYNIKRLNEMPVYHAFLERQLQDIQNARTITMANHILVMYLQATLAEEAAHSMEGKDGFYLLYEILKMYLNKLKSCSAPNENLVANLTVTMRQLAESCDHGSLFNECNGTRTQLVTQHVASENASFQFNNNYALVSTKIHVPVTHILQDISIPIQDSSITYRLNTFSLQTEVACQTPESDIQIINKPQHINHLTMMLQRLDGLPEAESPMRLVKKIITAPIVSQSAQNNFTSTFPFLIQHVPFFFNDAWKEPEAVSRSSSSSRISLPMWRRIIIKTSAEHYALQKNSLSENALSFQCMSKSKIKPSFPMHGAPILHNAKENGGMTFLASKKPCTNFQPAGYLKEAVSRVYSQDDSISPDNFSQKSFKLSSTSIEQLTEEKAEYRQVICPLNPHGFKKKHALSKIVHYATNKYGISKHSGLTHTGRNISKNSFRCVSRALVNYVPSSTKSLITYTPINVHASLLNTVFKNRPRQHHTKCFTLISSESLNKHVDLSSTTAVFKLKSPRKIFVLHDNFCKEIDSCRLSKSLKRLKTLNGSRPSYHSLLPSIDKKLLLDHLPKAAYLLFKFKVVKKKISFNGFALFALKKNFTENTSSLERSSQKTLCSRIPRRNSQQGNDNLQHQWINQLSLKTLHNRSGSVSTEILDKMYNFRFLPCDSSFTKNNCVKVMGKNTTRFSRDQLPERKDIEVVRGSKPSKSRRNEVACSIKKYPTFLMHSGFVNPTSFINKPLHLVNCAGDDLLNPCVSNLKYTCDPIVLKFSRINLLHSITSLQRGHMRQDSASLENFCDYKSHSIGKNKVKLCHSEKCQPLQGSTAISSAKCQGFQVAKESNCTNFKNFDLRKNALYQKEHKILKKNSQNESFLKSDFLSRNPLHIGPNHLEFNSKNSDVSCRIAKKNETCHLQKVNPRSRSTSDNGLIKLNKFITPSKNICTKEVSLFPPSRKLTLRQILEIWEKTRRDETLQHEVVEIFFETTFLLIKNVFLDYNDLKMSDACINEERVCGCRCLRLLHHDPIWFVKCSQKKEVLLLLEIWDHSLNNYPFCLIHIVHTFLDALMFGVEWKEWLLPSFFFSPEKKTSWGIQETFLKSFIHTFHSLNLIQKPFHLLILHVYVGVKLSDFLIDKKYNEKARDVLDEMALIDILLCLTTMWKNKQIPKPEILIHVVKGLRGFLSPRCLRFLNQTILLRRLMPLLCRCQPPLNSLTNKSWDDISYNSSVDWCTLKDIFFILKHVDSCYEFNNATLELLFCIILNLLRRSILMFSDPITHETSRNDSNSTQDPFCLTSLLNHFRYSLTLKESVRICQINGCLLLAQFFLRHNFASTAFLKNQGIDVVLILLKHVVKLLSPRSIGGFVDISVMQLSKSLMTLLCNSTFQNVDIQQQLGSRGVYNLLCLFSMTYWQQRSGLSQQVIKIGDEAIFVCLKAIGNISLFPENTQYCIKSSVDALYKLLFEFMVSNENRMTLENFCKFFMGLLDSFLNIVTEFMEESMIRFRFTIPHLLLLLSNAHKDEKIIILDILGCLTRCSKNAETFHNSQGHHYIPLQLVHLEQSKVILYDHLVLRLIEKQATRYPCSFIKLCDNGIFEAMKTFIQCQNTPPSIVTRIIRISVAGLTSPSQKTTVAKTLDSCGVGVALLQYLSSKLADNTKNTDTQRVATWICGLTVLMFCIIEESTSEISIPPIFKNTQLSHTLQQLDPDIAHVLLKQIIQLYFKSHHKTGAMKLTSKVALASNMSNQPPHILLPADFKKIGFSESNFVLTSLCLLVTFFRSPKATVYVDYCYSLDLLPLIVEILQFITADCFEFTMSCYLADQIFIILVWFYQYLKKSRWLQLCFNKSLVEALKDLRIYFEKLVEPTYNTIQKLVLKTFHHSSKPELNELQFHGKTMCAKIESIQDLLRSHKNRSLQCDTLHCCFKSVNYQFMMKNVFSFNSQGVQELENQFKKKLRQGILVKTIVFLYRPENKKTTEPKIVKPPFPITGKLSADGQCRFFPLLWKTSTNLLNLEGLCRSTGETIFSHSVTHVICVEQGLDAACFATCRTSCSQLLSKVSASHCCSLQLQISPNDATVVEVPLVFESANSCQNFIHSFLKWRNAVVLGLN